jgi:hypothetical protein
MFETPGGDRYTAGKRHITVGMFNPTTASMCLPAGFLSLPLNVP